MRPQFQWVSDLHNRARELNSLRKRQRIDRLPCISPDDERKPSSFLVFVDGILKVVWLCI
jgi:hypothetical protein